MADFSQEEMNGFLIGTSERTDLDLWTKSVVEMSGPHQVFVLIWELEAQVCNGGFQQYFHNDSGEGALLVVDALHKINAVKTSCLVEQAVQIIGKDTPWADWEARQNKVMTLSDDAVESLSALDQAFFQYEDNLTQLLFSYIISNIASFPPPVS